MVNSGTLRERVPRLQRADGTQEEMDTGMTKKTRIFLTSWMSWPPLSETAKPGPLYRGPGFPGQHIYAMARGGRLSRCRARGTARSAR
ncbi:hypothetical protein Ssi03_14310 [Sphaerisporangium siamense]|nr:hypothetical protein Ssi03_14310 [Sphaerisporangium siamense]